MLLLLFELSSYYCNYTLRCYGAISTLLQLFASKESRKAYTEVVHIPSPDDAEHDSLIAYGVNTVDLMVSHIPLTYGITVSNRLQRF